MLTLIQARCGQMGATESNMFDEVSSGTRRKGVCYPSLRSLWTYNSQRSGTSDRPTSATRQKNSMNWVMSLMKIKIARMVAAASGLAAMILAGSASLRIS